ncbi:MAG: substrate-binding domain-containing protein [Kiritimatiellae bacterium]|nr:substrate-binding domain-containing protein [Kiritimatiellia bacterium]
MKTILFFQSTISKSWREKLKGVIMFAQEQNWFVQVVSKSATEKEIRQAIKEWSPTGCLIDRGMNYGIAKDKFFKRIPTVYLDQEPSHPSHSRPCLLHDSGATASLAISSLFSRGCKSYAYIGTGTNLYWDRARFIQFKKETQARGATLSLLPHDGLKKAIIDLPKPCGILGANDEFAMKAFHAARSAGLSIPDDVAIVGIDNDEIYCESVTPGLTSVEPDFKGAGYRLAQMLADEIEWAKNNGGIPRRRPVVEKYGPIRIVQRGSTAIPQGVGPRVQRALEYIRRHACDEGVGLDGVIAEMNCSRRLATILFRKEIGHTILEEIHEQRFQKACHLLSHTKLPIAAVVAQCGYKSDSFLRKMFLRRTNLTLRGYRQTPNSHQMKFSSFI